MRSTSLRCKREDFSETLFVFDSLPQCKETFIMAAQWGSNSIAPGQSAGWFFARANTPGFLPVLQVMPLSPSFTDPSQWALTSGGYPYENQLGISTIWSQLSDDLSTVSWLMVVQNNSNNTIEYAFLESDL
jgi:hypothetical protein